ARGYRGKNHKRNRWPLELRYEACGKTDDIAGFTSPSCTAVPCRLRCLENSEIKVTARLLGLQIKLDTRLFSSARSFWRTLNCSTEVTMSRSTHILFGVILIAAIQTASAEPQTNVAATSAAPSAPSSLLFYFDSGSATVRPKDTALLDQASRLYREGKPIVMIV